jgi:hypothetical protein
MVTLEVTRSLGHTATAHTQSGSHAWPLVNMSVAPRTPSPAARWLVRTRSGTRLRTPTGPALTSLASPSARLGGRRRDNRRLRGNGWPYRPRRLLATWRTTFLHAALRSDGSTDVPDLVDPSERRRDDDQPRHRRSRNARHHRRCRRHLATGARGPATTPQGSTKPPSPLRAQRTLLPQPWPATIRPRRPRALPPSLSKGGRRQPDDGTPLA